MILTEIMLLQFISFSNKKVVRMAIQPKSKDTYTNVSKHGLCFQDMVYVKYSFQKAIFILVFVTHNLWNYETHLLVQKKKTMCVSVGSG